jgi:hypothetical protein
MPRSPIGSDIFQERVELERGAATQILRVIVQGLLADPVVITIEGEGGKTFDFVMQRLYTLRGAVWIIVYLLFILAPLLGSHPPTRDLWTEFSVAIGYAGLAMMGLQFGLTARFR